MSAFAAAPEAQGSSECKGWISKGGWEKSVYKLAPWQGLSECWRGKAHLVQGVTERSVGG